MAARWMRCWPARGRVIPAVQFSTHAKNRGDVTCLFTRICTTLFHLQSAVEPADRQLRLLSSRTSSNPARQEDLPMHAEALPEGLRRFAGRIVDVDSHEMMPVQAWIPTFGSDLQPLVDSWLAHGQSERNNLNHPNVPDYPGDVMKIDARVYDVKGSRAPGATDPFRRLEVMDALGVNRQLMFPGVSGYAMLLALLADNPNYMASVKGDRQKRREVAERWMRLYDRWSF